MADTFQPPFQECVQKARASGIMCAYNSVNGIPSCANHNLLTNIARRQWGFHGYYIYIYTNEMSFFFCFINAVFVTLNILIIFRYITSDCDAVSNVFHDHKYTRTPEDTVAAVLNAGINIFLIFIKDLSRLNMISRI